MGIRVHKVLGYGIADLKSNNHNEICDPRVDTEKFRQLMNDSYDLMGPKLLVWFRKEKDNLIRFHKRVSPHIKDGGDFDFCFRMLENGIKSEPKGKQEVLGDYATHDGEFGIPGVLLFRPLMCRDWSRYDNIIDYYEEPINRFRFLDNTGIYPWNGPMIRFRPAPRGVWKDKESEEKYAVMEGGHYNQFVGRWDPNQKPFAEGRFLKHLLEDYRPKTPFELHVILWYYRKAFKDIVGLLNNLRPMIYVYWS